MLTEILTIEDIQLSYDQEIISDPQIQEIRYRSKARGKVKTDIQGYVLKP